jgi:hypothetical protein
MPIYVVHPNFTSVLDPCIKTEYAKQSWDTPQFNKAIAKFKKMVGLTLFYSYHNLLKISQFDMYVKQLSIGDNAKEPAEVIEGDYYLTPLHLTHHFIHHGADFIADVISSASTQAQV